MIHFEPISGLSNFTSWLGVPNGGFSPWILLALGVFFLFLRKVIPVRFFSEWIFVSFFVMFFFIFRGFQALDLAYLSIAFLVFLAVRCSLLVPWIPFFLYLVLIAPTILFLSSVELPRPDVSHILFLNMQIIGRVFVWSWEVGVLKKVPRSTLLQFLEYLFCPFFFLVPNLLFVLPYSRFLEGKRSLSGGREYLALMILLGWAFISFEVFSLMGRHFFPTVLPYLESSLGNLSAIKFLFIGIFWFIFWYFHHCAGVGIQVSCAKMIGYQLDYDMRLPFLSRSPMDFFRRNHYYVREFTLMIFYRPLLLAFLRLKLSQKSSTVMAGISACALLTLPFMGWRENEADRSFDIWLLLLLSVAGYLVLDAIFRKSSTPNFAGESEERSSLEEIRSLTRWGWRDYLQCLGTNFLLSSAKGCIAWFKSLSF